MARFTDVTGKLRFLISKREVERELFENSKYFGSDDFKQKAIWEAYNLNKKSIDDEFKKKYFKFDQNQMNILLDEAKKQELNEEVKETMKEIGVNDDKEVKKVSEKLQEDEIKDPNKKKNKSRKEMQADIIKAAAYNASKEFGKEVAKQKESQIEDKRIGLTEKEAAKDIREQVLIKEMSRKYKKITHEDLSKNKSINNLQKNIEKKVNGLEKGAENRLANEFSIREKLEQKVQEKEREYNKAIERNDPKVEDYKKEYEDACYELANLKNSQRDYSEQLEKQKELEDKADKKGVLKQSGVAQEMNYSKRGPEKKISESANTKSFEKGVEKNERQKELTDDKADTIAKDLKKEERYTTLEEIEAQRKKSAEVQTNINRGKIDGVQYKDNFHDTRKTVVRNDKELEQKQEEKFDDFRSELRGNVCDPSENASKIVNDNERAYEKYQKQTKKDAQKDNIEAQRVMRKNKKYGNPNSN